jgi:hypothetical protein
MRPDTSGSIGSWDRRGRTLRTSISLVVISFAALIGTADAQYLPPQEPPGGYPPPAYYPYRGYPPPAGLSTTCVLSGQSPRAVSGHLSGRRWAGVRR